MLRCLSLTLMIMLSLGALPIQAQSRPDYRVYLPLVESTPLRYAAWGDSITVGVGASSTATRWSTLLAAALSRQLDSPVLEINRSVNGTAVTTWQAPRLAADVLAYEPEIVVLAGGLNDMRLGTPVSEFAVAYEQMLHQVNAAPSVRLVVCATLPHMTAYSATPPWDRGSDALSHQYNAEIARLALAHRCRLADVHTTMAHDDSLLVADGIHPNDRGHAAIAAAVLSSLAQPAAERPLTPADIR